ncbi:MAG TPA: carbon monoxide dehydrogenase [Alphaproteobacteria bacterium]|nr:carbon monoxide dehydrogenase [Alphaproteobacteria bacterium]
MKMSGEYRIAAPRDTVWSALNDPEILRQCIPGCEALDQVSATEMTGAVTAKIGPVKATFKGDVTLSEVDAPNSYVLSGQGKGGAAGFAKGSARVTLSDIPEGTLLSYDVDAQVGGKLAQLGQRLIDGTAKKLSDEFFGNFATRLGGAPAEDASGTAVEADEVKHAGNAATPEHNESEAEEEQAGLPPAVWIAGLIGLMTILVFVFAG